MKFILGVMSGTSLDGVDCVLAAKKSKSLELIDFGSKKFPKALRTKLLQAAHHQINVSELGLLHHELGRFYSDAISSLIKNKKWSVDLIGLHGQTVFHAGKRGTLQIGEPSYLSATLKVPVIADFRVGDISVGGEGAPLATYFHAQVLAQGGIEAIHNLGGISNVTFLKEKAALLAFDTGPANLPMDLAMQTWSRKKFDDNGRIARSGKRNERLVDRWLKHRYFFQNVPKSCGREEFGLAWLEKNKTVLAMMSHPDRLATLTEFVARSISLAYERHAPQNLERAIFCGGGAYNSYLLERLQSILPCQVMTSHQLGWPPETVEGGAFALLALRRWQKVPIDLRFSTGASKPCLLGKIVEV